MNNECNIKEVNEIEVPYKLNCTMIEPIKFKNYDRKVKKKEDKNLIKEWEEER